MLLLIYLKLQIKKNWGHVPAVVTEIQWEVKRSNSGETSSFMSG
jgi:hypothetical protein